MKRNAWYLVRRISHPFLFAAQRIVFQPSPELLVLGECDDEVHLNKQRSIMNNSNLLSQRSTGERVTDCAVFFHKRKKNDNTRRKRIYVNMTKNKVRPLDKGRKVEC